MAARAAFRGSQKPEPSFEPAVPAGPQRPLDDEEAMRAFIGPNWRSYQRLWNRDRLNPRFRSSLGLGPMLLGATWLIFRKRYLLGFVFVAAEATTAYLAPLFTLIVSLMLRGIVGRYGKSLVLKAGAQAIERERRGDGATNLRLQRLREAGGVNLWLPVLLILGETWLAVNQMHRPHMPGLDPAGLLVNVRDALP